LSASGRAPHWRSLGSLGAHATRVASAWSSCQRCCSQPCCHSRASDSWRTRHDPTRPGAGRRRHSRRNHATQRRRPRSGGRTVRVCVGCLRAQRFPPQRDRGGSVPSRSRRVTERSGGGGPLGSGGERNSCSSGCASGDRPSVALGGRRRNRSCSDRGSAGAAPPGGSGTQRSRRAVDVEQTWFTECARPRGTRARRRRLRW
jgi:hypothetical protein